MSVREETMLTIISARHDILAVANPGTVERLKLDLIDALLDLASADWAPPRTDPELILGHFKETRKNGQQETHRVVT